MFEKIEILNNFVSKIYKDFNKKLFVDMVYTESAYTYYFPTSNEKPNNIKKTRDDIFNSFTDPINKNKDGIIRELNILFNINFGKYFTEKNVEIKNEYDFPELLDDNCLDIIYKNDILLEMNLTHNNLTINDYNKALEYEGKVKKHILERIDYYFKGRSTEIVTKKDQLETIRDYFNNIFIIKNAPYFFKRNIDWFSEIKSKDIIDNTDNDFISNYFIKFHVKNVLKMLSINYTNREELLEETSLSQSVEIFNKNIAKNMGLDIMHNDINNVMKKISNFAVSDGRVVYLTCYFFSSINRVTSHSNNRDVKVSLLLYYIILYFSVGLLDLLKIYESIAKIDDIINIKTGSNFLYLLFLHLLPKKTDMCKIIVHNSIINNEFLALRLFDMFYNYNVNRIVKYYHEIFFDNKELKYTTFKEGLNNNRQNFFKTRNMMFNLFIDYFKTCEKNNVLSITKNFTVDSKSKIILYINQEYLLKHYVIDQKKFEDTKSINFYHIYKNENIRKIFSSNIYKFLALNGFKKVEENPNKKSYMIKNKEEES